MTEITLLSAIQAHVSFINLELTLPSDTKECR